MSGKNKYVLLVIATLLALLILVLWRHQRPVPAVAEQSQSQSATTSQAPAQAAPTPSSGAVRQTRTLEEGLAVEKKRADEMLSTFQTLNHNPVEFYGRVVDQYGEPVVGASVQGDLLYDTGNKSGMDKVSTATDAQGYFQFRDLRGESLGIGIAKDGYEYRRENSLFSYSYFEADHKRHVPDPKNPVIFKLWKKQGAEVLVHYGRDIDIPADGSSVRIDLATGKVSANGDMIITLKRTPLQMQFGTAGYAWQASVEIVGGGMVRAGEHGYYNVAPEAGYQPRFEYTQEATDLANIYKVKWKERVDENVYVKSLDGQRYARVGFGIAASGRKTNDSIGGFSFGVWLNPNGSRNLEFDPAKAITPPR